MIRSILIYFWVVHLALHGTCQPSTLQFPDLLVIPANFQKAINEQTAEYTRLIRNDSVVKNYSTIFILQKIDNDSNYGYLFQAEYWIAFHYREVIPELIKRVTVKKEIGLINSADLIIWERVQNKQMKFYGHGGLCDDDLFTIAGRANRLLSVISGEDFGHVSMYSTKEQLVELQNKWVKWLLSIVNTQ